MKRLRLADIEDELVPSSLPARLWRRFNRFVRPLRADPYTGEEALWAAEVRRARWRSLIKRLKGVFHVR